MRKRTEGKKKKRVDIFETEADRGKLPPIPDIKAGFREVITRIFDSDIDLVKEFDLIEKSLSITGDLNPGVINRSANNAERMAARAYKLYVVGKLEYESYMRRTEGIVAVIRDSATNVLEKKKAAKQFTKQITDADVLAACAQHFPDEWEDINDRRDRAKLMLGYLSNLADLSKKRCFTISKMLAPSGDL